MYLFVAAEPVFSIFDFQNNIVNWVILVGVIVWLGSKSLPAMFANRKSSIETALQDAALARAEGQNFLGEQKTRLANASFEADNILVEAKQIAQNMQTDIETQTQKDMAGLRLKLEHDITNQRNLAISQLRTAASIAAITLTETTLPESMTDSSRKRLLGQFVDQLEALKS